MEPTREIYWNAPVGLLVDLLGIVIFAYVGYGIVRRARLWGLGKADSRFTDLVKRTWSFVTLSVSEFIAHRRLLRDLYPGMMHFLIFGGICLLFLATVMVMVSHYTPFYFLHGTFYLWFSLFADLAGLAVLIGLAMAAYRRYVTKPTRLDNLTDDWVVLTFLAVIVLTGFVVEGLRMAETELTQHPDWAAWSPIGWLFAQAFGGLSADSLRVILHGGLWWVHPLIFFGGAIYAILAFSKFSHIVLAPMNAFLKSSRPRGVPATIDFENSESFGVSKVQDLTWKDLLDLDTCTRCGRCQDVCPAYLTGKPLSPKKLIQDLRTNFLETSRQPAAKPETNGNGRSLIGDVITEDVLWACNLCLNCEEVCPVYIEHTSKIIDMRRNLVLEQASMPETAQASLVSVQKRGHPWTGTTYTRTDWMAGLDVPVASEGGDPGLLFWVGCTGALQERNVKVTIAFAKVLMRAGVKFSALGDQESCCGHHARRLGDEYLFQTQAEKNIEVLKAHNVQRIVTMCPHGYHTIKNEYPQFGGTFEVVHHTELLLQLLKDGRISLDGAKAQRVTYQDPCYLGRFNGLYDVPRELVKSLPHLKLAEMSHHRTKGLCCGAGGGRMWVDESPEERVSNYRFKEAVQTNAETVVAACPFCLQMGEDAIKSLGKEDTMKAVDVAELIETAMVQKGAAEPAAKN